MVCSAHQATNLVSCLLLPQLGEPWPLAHLLSVGNVLPEILIIITQRLGYPRVSKKGRGFSSLCWEKTTSRSRTPEGCAGAFGIHGALQRKQRSLPQWQECLKPQVSLNHTGLTGGVALQAQPSLHDWILLQWILIKFYWEKLCFDISDGNSFLKNIFKITAVVLWKHPVAYLGGKVLSASEMWVVVLWFFRAFGCLASVLIWCCYLWAPVYA